MGCSSSKPAEAPQKQLPQSSVPSKTLLLNSEESKALGDAKSPVVAAPSSTVVPPTGQSALAATTAASLQSNAVNNEVETQQPHEEVKTHQPHNVDGALLGHGALFPESGSRSTHSYLLRKQGTVCTEANELNVMVVGFTSHDSTVGSVIGRNCKEMQWKVMCDIHAAPIDVKLNVQEHKLHYNEVSIESKGQYIFSGPGSHAKAKMVEDFHYEWPFRAMIRGINEVGFFEYHPPHGPADVWFPAVITGQRPDGYFEVRAREVDANGRAMEMTYPAVRREDLREAASRKPLAIPEDSLKLYVPKQDPLKATLCLANGDLVTHHFGRPSPAIGAPKPELALKVSKDRARVTANVGHRTLSHFVSGEVQATQHEAERLKHSWTIQVGLFAEHKIEVTKKYTLGKIVTLLVDGEVLVEASAADFGCDGNEWTCKFKFIGERLLDFELFKTNIDGAPLDETDHVKERRKYVHECTVVIPNEWDFHSARLAIDGAEFHELPVKPPQYEEEPLSIDPTAMLHSHGISTPYKVDPNAPSNVMMFAKSVMGRAEEGRKAAQGWFNTCYCSPIADDEGPHGVVIRDTAKLVSAEHTSTPVRDNAEPELAEY